ncbi:MAG: hypothetical protein U1E51_23800, partial [Candidatus Binatia bacterium]|nr:hypothetical protein [Candidatus Binatia bacterium]
MNPLQAADLQQERDLARRRLTEEMPSENTRTLAYRVSLIVGQFSRQIAIALAEMAPPITLPGENFENLVGPWIERVATDVYRVSPLLQNAGEKVLSTAETRAVHETVALRISQTRTLSPHDFSTALVHGMIAKSAAALGRLALGALRGASRDVWLSLADAAFWFPSAALQPGQRLCENDANVETLLRVLQFRIAAAGKRINEALAILDRTIELIDSLPKGKPAALNATISYSAFLISVDIPIPPQKAIDMISRLMDLRETDSTLKQAWDNFDVAQRQRDNPLAGLSADQVLFSMRVSQV